MVRKSRSTYRRKRKSISRTRKRRSTGTSRSRSRSRSRRRKRKSRKCVSSRPVSWKPQKSKSNLPLCPPPKVSPCANPCNNRSEWIKLAWKNGYFLTWSKLLAQLNRCDPGSNICPPFGGITPPNKSIADFQKQFKPRVAVVLGLGNPGGSDYTLTSAELSFSTAVLAPPATGTVKGRCIAGPLRGKRLENFDDNGYPEFPSVEAMEPLDVSVVVGGVQRFQGAGLFDQLVEINGEAVLLAQDFCRMPAWPISKSTSDHEKDKLLIPVGPGCCLPFGIAGSVGIDIPIMRTPIPPGSALDDMLYGSCRVPVLKTGVGATLPSQVRRSLSFEKNPMNTVVSKQYFIKENKSLTSDNAGEKFDKFKVIFNKQIPCGQDLVEQLLVNTIGDGTSFGYFGKENVDPDTGTEQPVFESVD